MDIRLGRHSAAVPGRQVHQAVHQLAAARSLVRPGCWGAAHHPHLARQCQQHNSNRRCSAAAEAAGSSSSSSSYGQPAVSTNPEAAAVLQPETLAEAAAAAGDSGHATNSSNNSNNNSSAVVQAAAADVTQPLPQLDQQQQQQPQQPPQQQPKATKKVSNFINRVIFGIILGFGGAAIVAKGALLYLCATMFVVYHATQEFYGFLTSSGISQGMPPPSPFVSAATTALCLSITVFTYFGHGRSGAAMSAAAFCLLVLNVLGTPKPKFAQLASSVFGLFYCGYLPSFWIKLRNLDVAGPHLQLPWVSNEVVAGISQYLPDLTVGLIATLTTVACIIAADTGAYFVGKNLGRTKLTDISPKKTVEGALGGLASAVAVAVLFWKLFAWPGSVLAAAGYGVLTFTSSLFGDLIESIMKRDAGLKDSGNLIPGHGGLLDRFDSYIFSGALGYFYITALLPFLA